MNRRVQFFVLVSTLCALPLVCAPISSTQYISFEHSIDRYSIEQIWPRKMSLRSLSMFADCPIDTDEIRYLLGFSDGSDIDAHTLWHGFLLLQKKKSFLGVTLTRHSYPDCVDVELRFDGVWRLSKVVVGGWMTGKDRYRALYELEVGQPFDEAKHQDSLEKIQRFLYDEGFFDARVAVTLQHDICNKEVVVVLNIQKNDQFLIGFVECSFQCGDQNFYEIAADITKKFLKPLRRLRYGKRLLNKKACALTQYIERMGYGGVQIALEERLDYQKSLVHLQWKITITQGHEIIFFGNRYASSKKLLAIIAERGGALGCLPASVFAEELQQWYRAKGFWDARVTAREESGRVFYMISEGRRYQLRSIIARGKYAKRALGLFAHCCPELSAGGYYDKSCFDGIGAKIEQECYRKGFWDAQATIDVVMSTYENVYDLVVQVDTGKPLRIKRVNIFDYPELEKKWPFCYPHCYPIATKELLERQRDALQQFVMRKGYDRVQVTHAMERHDDDLEIKWQVQQQQSPVCFGKTVVIGNLGMPFTQLKKVLQYQEGELWDAKKIKGTVERLQRLAIFESVRLRQDYQSNDTEHVTMMLEVCPEDPFEVRFRIGAGIQRVYDCGRYGRGTYRIGGSFLYKNISCAADHALLEVDFSRSYRRLIARYIRPWFGDTSVRSIVELYANTHNHPGFIGYRKNPYEVKQAGVYTRFEYDRSPVAASMACGFQVDEATLLHCTAEGRASADRVARAICFDRCLFEKQLPYFFVQPAIVLDVVDSPVEPTVGYYGALSCKAMVPLFSSDHHAGALKLVAEQSFFVPHGPFVLAAHFYAGAIVYQDFCYTMPTERFYLGGPRSIRSYQYGMCPPLGFAEDECGDILVLPQGGNATVSGTIELRFPLGSSIKGAVFQDIGYLGNGMGPGSRVAGSGFGFRIPSPLGPLAFDIAWNWHQQKGVFHDFAWFVTFGRAF